jgi:eukaryotic-like serine/threonine-protein kinase
MAICEAGYRAASMNTERWQRMNELFHPALQLSRSRRTEFLEQACAGDTGLYRELVALLKSSQPVGTTLRNVVAAEVKRLASDVVGAQIGRRIGAFRLIKLLGTGGMGAVYLAERDDAEFSHRVAIKILLHAVVSSEAIARFRDERQILAALEHPNIVRLLDGGSGDDQLPYLVMEHIEGTTLTRYAEHRQLPVRARVELMRQVCTALQYAHQNLVVHRDIKPSNILVDIDGTPKILDFGIAKLLAPGAAFEREARTRTGAGMFTPEYASPEQARGDAVSTASDVYSLGAVLYELLTGRSPHRAAGSALDIRRVICEVDPPRPSTIAPHARRRELAGDLDNIILKALHKEPARRYASMEQLGEDLRRWLDGLPVLARTPTFGYSALKFVRRNKLAVVAAMLVVCTLLAATVVSLRQARRADEQALRAEAEARNANYSAVRALDEQARAELEATRARNAELQLTEQLDRFRAEQNARVACSATASAQRARLSLMQGQIEILLARVEHNVAVARSQWTRGKEAELRARAAQQDILDALQLLQDAERERVKAIKESPALVRELRR